MTSKKFMNPLFTELWKENLGHVQIRSIVDTYVRGYLDRIEGDTVYLYMSEEHPRKLAHRTAVAIEDIMFVSLSYDVDETDALTSGESVVE